MSAPGTPFTSVVIPATEPKATLVILSEPAWNDTVPVLVSTLVNGALPVALTVPSPFSSTPMVAF